MGGIRDEAGTVFVPIISRRSKPTLAVAAYYSIWCLGGQWMEERMLHDTATL